jgi:hypothetical protein
MARKIEERIDELAKKHARSALRTQSSLSANRRIHVAAMGGLSGLGVAFLRFAGDTTLGQAFGIVCLVVFLFLILTGFLCLQNHGVF